MRCWTGLSEKRDTSRRTSKPWPECETHLQHLCVFVGGLECETRPPTRLPQVVERPCQHLTMVGSTLAILGFTMRCLWKRDKLLPKVRDCPGKPTVEKYDV